MRQQQTAADFAGEHIHTQNFAQPARSVGKSSKSSHIWAKGSQRMVYVQHKIRLV